MVLVFTACLALLLAAVQEELAMYGLIMLAIVMLNLLLWMFCLKFRNFLSWRGPFLPIAIQIGIGCGILVSLDQGRMIRIGALMVGMILSSFWISSFVGNLKGRYDLTTEQLFAGVLCFYGEMILLAAVLAAPIGMIFLVLWAKDYFGY